MKISLNWLKDFAPFELTGAEAAALGAKLGLEISEMERRFVGFDQFVVGEVMKIEKHPDAEKLRLVTVDLGSETPRLVCGAPNVREGLRVAVGMEGAVLPNGMKLKKAKIRGVESRGMILSRAELSLEEKSSGVWDLPPTASIGSTLRDLVGPEDTILTFEITPNRADVLSHWGVARDFSAALGLPLTMPDCTVKTTSPRKVEEYASVAIEAPDLCHRYCAMAVDGVTVGPSPLWMQERLASVGFRPLSNVVDVTNYLLIEMGHPMHAFDLSRLKGSKIIVRRAKAGEKERTLDGEEHAFTTENLVIADAERPVAVAGVMGGGNSEVIGTTKTILLESAYFLPSSVRKTARSLGMNTESSYRFERGTDILGLEQTIKRCAQLITQTAGGSVAQGMIDVFPSRPEPAGLTVRTKRVASVLGFAVEDSKIQTHLERLHFGVTKKSDGVFAVEVPPFRADISREIDLIEEVARLEGYDKIPATLPAKAGAQHTPRIHTFVNQTRRALEGLGFSECLTYPFEREELVGIEKRPIRVANPINAEEPLLRTSLLPSLARVCRHNLNHGLRGIRLFEAGTSFFLRDGEPAEEAVVAVALSKENDVALHAPNENSFATLKGVLQTLLPSGVEFKPADSPFLQKGESAEILLDGERVGTAGLLSQKLREAVDLDDAVYGAEINLTRLLPKERRVPVYEPLPRHPASLRDLAVIVDESVPWAEIEAAVQKSAGELLEEITLFDVYGGKGAKGIEAGKRSLAFRLTFRAPDRTLTVDEVEAAQRSIVEALAEAHGAQLRGA